jgi:site-specific recombinase XerD
MTLSKHKSGYYYIYYNDPKTARRTSLSCKTKRKLLAVEFLSNFEREYKNRKSNKIIPISLEEFIIEFTSYSEATHTQKTTSAYRNTFNQLNKYFGSTLLTNLSTTLLRKYIQSRMSSSSVYAARKDLINLKCAFNKAVQDHYVLENPCQEISSIKLPEKQPLFFSRSEYELLLQVINDEILKNMIEIAANTGLRQMELITLEWEQVSIKERHIILNNRNYLTKGKKVRSVPINIRGLQILNQMEQSSTSRYVFTRNGKKYKPDYVSRIFKKSVRESKVNPELHFHSLRHTFASWLVQRGVSIYHVSKLLGHADIKTTEIYAHLRAEDLRASVDMLS